MQKDFIRLGVIADLGTKANFSSRLQQGGLERLEWPPKSCAMVIPYTPRSATARLRTQKQSLAALEAENIALRSRVVELALQIQALND